MHGFPWLPGFVVMVPKLYWCHQNSLLISVPTTTSMPRLIGLMLSFWHGSHHYIQRVSIMNSDLALLNP